MKFYHLINSFLPLKKWVNKKIEQRNNQIIRKILPMVKKGGIRILDIGSGTGHTAHELIRKGYKVTCTDVEDMNIFKNTKPIICSGDKLPFKTKSFDTSLLITVLHHTSDPEQIIKEAMRVSDKIIIMEDTYNSALQKYLTFIMDSIGNMQFFNHPHSNKNDKEWRKVFERLKIKVEEVKKQRFLVFFESTTYLLRK